MLANTTYIVKYKNKSYCGFKKNHKYCIYVSNDVYGYIIEGRVDLTEDEDMHNMMRIASEKSFNRNFDVVHEEMESEHVTDVNSSAVTDEEEYEKEKAKKKKKVEEE